MCPPARPERRKRGKTMEEIINVIRAHLLGSTHEGNVITFKYEGATYTITVDEEKEEEKRG